MCLFRGSTFTFREHVVVQTQPNMTSTDAATPATMHSISENLEVLRNFIRTADSPPQRPGIMSTARTLLFVASPVLIIGFLGYVLSNAAGSGSEPFCVCPDGGIRSGVSRRRFAA